jgi:MYXO-CTERM domain-containing protein
MELVSPAEGGYSISHKELTMNIRNLALAVAFGLAASLPAAAQQQGSQGQSGQSASSGGQTTSLEQRGDRASGNWGWLGLLGLIGLAGLRGRRDHTYDSTRRTT